MRVLYIGVVMLAVACGNRELDTPTTGNIRIAVDETFKPVIDSEIDVFHAQYKYANINPLYLPEADVFKLLFEDSVQLAVVSRTLTTADSAYFKTKQLYPRTIEVARDAIALITHPANKDTSLTLEDLERVFKGEVTRWDQLDPGNASGDIQIVFDHSRSSTARYIRERFSKQLSPNTYSAESNPAVVDYVAQQPRALGVIGVNYVSDTDDSTVIDFLKRINVLRISADSTDPKGKQPYQAHIVQGNYPLTRSIYFINTEGRSGLGTGFTSFVASDPGQLIFLKAGLVPARGYIRIMSIEQ